MEEANGGNVIWSLMGALNRTRRAYNRAVSAVTPELENRELRLLGDDLMVVGLYNTAVSYHAFINPPARNLAYAMPTYFHVIPLVSQCFTFVNGITAVVIAWLLIVSDNPRQHNRLLKVIMLLVFIASCFTVGMLLQEYSSSG